MESVNTTILSIGGSLGANSINHAVKAGLDQLAAAGMQIIWQTGTPFADEGKAAGSGKQNVWVGAFIKEMDLAYAAADVVISRAGAMSVAELCVAAKPAVFVPYPFAAEDHQTFNAKALVDKEAAVMIKDADAKALLIDTVLALAKNIELQEIFKLNISKMAIKNADELIAGEILKSI